MALRKQTEPISKHKHVNSDDDDNDDDNDYDNDADDETLQSALLLPPTQVQWQTGGHWDQS